MTFCLSVKVKDGLVAIADTRVTSGSECITARKVTTLERDGQSLYIMTSGLRSVRDKALTYFEEQFDAEALSFDRLFKAVNAFALQVRRCAQEDRAALAEAGLTFNLHALIGGQMPHDREHKLYLVYPQGNWVEIGAGTPYHIIGAVGYGKPVLDRTLHYGDPMELALKVGCLAFDSTRISAADVGFPIDVVLYARDSFRMIERRFDKTELEESSKWWQERLRLSVNELPNGWMKDLIDRLPRPAPRPDDAHKEQP